jgi:hypothetical protein
VWLKLSPDSIDVNGHRFVVDLTLWMMPDPAGAALVHVTVPPAATLAVAGTNRNGSAAVVTATVAGGGLLPLGPSPPPQPAAKATASVAAQMPFIMEFSG